MKNKLPANKQTPASGSPVPKSARALAQDLPVASVSAEEAIRTSVPDGEVVSSELLYQSADDSDLRESILEIWRDRPAVLFKDLCGCAIMTIEHVAVAYWEAGKQT